MAWLIWSFVNKLAPISFLDTSVCSPKSSMSRIFSPTQCPCLIPRDPHVPTLANLTECNSTPARSPLLPLGRPSVVYTASIQAVRYLVGHVATVTPSALRTQVTRATGYLQGVASVVAIASSATFTQHALKAL
ncbi:hypothetical protein D9619_008787 [Psilocybe cf. subviscida]|uniref:Uncharacterized protein n=1 Tax=Psilocybe cf. subviscida TaxID=2480587 RepID=A0A8H5BBJ3_9AGAR|nr:hypothetical protein D9619_008787 [Psilocybe cf. subviscida]